MLESLAETGEINFSRAKPPVRKYPVSEEVSALVERIFEANNIRNEARLEMRAPMRHLFWYADSPWTHRAGLQLYDAEA
jgi:hypothetical protein